MPNGEKIQITWTDFDMESSHGCVFDSVEVTVTDFSFLLCVV